MKVYQVVKAFYFGDIERYKIVNSATMQSIRRDTSIFAFFVGFLYLLFAGPLLSSSILSLTSGTDLQHSLSHPYLHFSITLG